MQTPFLSFGQVVVYHLHGMLCDANGSVFCVHRSICWLLFAPFATGITRTKCIMSTVPSRNGSAYGYGRCGSMLLICPSTIFCSSVSFSNFAPLRDFITAHFGFDCVACRAYISTVRSFVSPTHAIWECGEGGGGFVCVWVCRNKRNIIIIFKSVYCFSQPQFCSSLSTFAAHCQNYYAEPLKSARPTASRRYCRFAVRHHTSTSAT